MFFVINKNKIYTYVITICMVVVLFVLSFAMITNSDKTVITSTNVEDNNDNIQNNNIILYENRK